ncbi:MAG: cupin domain-containing protein [Solirubrobacteraceae bacterium]
MNEPLTNAATPAAVTEPVFLPPVRRVVTGHDDEGRSIIVSDGPSPHSNAPAIVPELVARVLWTTESIPASNAGNADAAPAGVVPPISPAPGGTIFRIADFPPDTRYDGIDIERMFQEINAADAHAAGNGNGDQRHFWFHRTDTLDYAIVLEGEVWAMMDVGECLLRAGDVLIQRGTNHAWSNRSDQPCRVAFVLIDALPDGR